VVLPLLLQSTQMVRNVHTRDYGKFRLHRGGAGDAACKTEYQYQKHNRRFHNASTSRFPSALGYVIRTGLFAYFCAIAVADCHFNKK
jgi:hypothetical protein